MEDEDFANRCNLIVNYVPPIITEEGFRALFAPFGTMESCKLMVDKNTKTSLGYGFVKYSNPDYATKAIQTMNGQVVQAKVLKVAYARPSSATIQNANLYVGQLESTITKEHLDQIFFPYGKIIDSKILNGDSRGVGFVRYDTRAQAEAAINALNGVVLPNTTTPLIVKFADNVTDKAKRKNKGNTQLMGGNMNLGGNMFRGQATPYPIGRDQMGRYQNYSYSPNVPLVPSPVAPIGLYDQALALDSHSMLQNQQFSHYCLFVYHLPPDSDENSLYRLFGPFGAIASVKIIREMPSGNCKGYGFVNYLKLEDAQQAIMGLNGYQLGAKPLQVSFKSQKQ